MLDNKILQQIRDKILGVTGGVHGDLNSTVYLQQIRDAILGVSGLKPGSLHEIIYLQQIRNAILGVPDGQFGSMPAFIYLQEILNAYNGVTAQPNGNLDDGVYLDAIAVVATGGDTTAPVPVITSTETSPTFAATIPLTIVFKNGLTGENEAVTGFAVGDITIAGCTLSGFTTADNITFTVTATPTANSITIDIAAGVCKDATGNDNLAATQFAITALIYGMKQWRDFSDLTTLFQDDAGTTPVTADAQPIGKGLDKSGNNNHVTQAVAGNKPIYKANIQGGKGIGRFVPANSHRLISAIVASMPQPNTAFLVCNFTTPVDTGTYLAVDGRESGKQEAFYYLGGATKKPTAFAGTNLSHTTIYTPSFKVYSAVYNGASSLFRMDGVEVTGNAGTQACTGWTIGSNQAQTSFMAGDIGEYIFYAGALTGPLILQIETYLKNRWGLNP